jgi:hypothetical protein
MKEASIGYAVTDIAKGLAEGVGAGARKLIRELTPEIQRPTNNQEEDCAHVEVDPRQQETMDSSRLKEVRGLLRSFAPQKEGMRTEKASVVGRSVAKPPVDRGTGQSPV